VGDERAQTYLRLLAEQQACASPRSGPDIARSVEQVRWAGEILAYVGVIEETDVHRIATELEAALLIRSDLERPRYARRVGWALEVLSGEGGELTWQGAIGLPGALPPRARWLDLIADGTQRLVRIELNQADIQAANVAEPAPAIPPGERLLAMAAERILDSAWDDDGPKVDPRLDEAITVLTAAGALPADSPVPGRLAALCERLGVAEHGIGAAPAADLPARWAEVLPREPPCSGAEWFAPLGPAVADLEDARFVMAGLATAAGQSFLHVVATGMAPLPIHGHDTGLSWWVGDGDGHWHLAMVSDPHSLQPSGAMRFEAAPFRLRLTPPLRARPDHIEVVVTGRTARARVVVPVGADREMPDT